MMGGHLTCLGDLTLPDLDLKFSQHMRKRCMVRCAKNLTIFVFPDCQFSGNLEKNEGGSQEPPIRAKVDGEYCHSVIYANGIVWYYTPFELFFLGYFRLQEGFVSALPYLFMWIVSNIAAFSQDKLMKSEKLSKTTIRKLFSSTG